MGGGTCGTRNNNTNGRSLEAEGRGRGEEEGTRGAGHEKKTQWKPMDTEIRGAGLETLAGEGGVCVSVCER